MYISFSYSILISLYKFGYLSYWLNILCIVAGNCSIAIFFLHTHNLFLILYYSSVGAESASYLAVTLHDTNVH